MIYFFGWGQTTNKNLDSVRLVCKRCGHQAVFDLRIVRSWVSFFFIPLIPYAKRYWFMCRNCDSGYKFDSRKESEFFHTKLLAYKAKKIKRLNLRSSMAKQ